MIKTRKIIWTPNVALTGQIITHKVVLKKLKRRGTYKT